MDSGTDSRSSVLTENDGQHMINDENKIQCKILCDKIRKSLKEYILGNLK